MFEDSDSKSGKYSYPTNVKQKQSTSKTTALVKKHANGQPQASGRQYSKNTYGQQIVSKAIIPIVSQTNEAISSNTP